MARLGEDCSRRGMEGPEGVDTMSRERCAACGRSSEGHYSIHRDRFEAGPEVPLCNGCGSKPTPTCEQLWAAIAKRLPGLSLTAEPSPGKVDLCEPNP